MITNAYQQTEDILNQHMDKLHQVAQYLFKHEKMSGEEFYQMMGASAVESLPQQDDYWKVDDEETSETE